MTIRSAFRIPSSAFLLFLFVSSLSAQSSWHRPSYHDIIIGRSTKAAVLKSFGPPSEIQKPSLTTLAAACCEELVYRAKGDNGGDLFIAVQKNGPVVYVLDQFKSSMPRSTAYHKYGKDWHSHTYSSAKCAERAGVAPLYRDPAGNIELVQYPDKGFLFWPSQDAYDFFGVLYLAQAPGLPKPPACVKKK